MWRWRQWAGWVSGREGNLKPTHWMWSASKRKLCWSAWKRLQTHVMGRNMTSPQSQVRKHIITHWTSTVTLRVLSGDLYEKTLWCNPFFFFLRVIKLNQNPRHTLSAIIHVIIFTHLNFWLTNQWLKSLVPHLCPGPKNLKFSVN